MKIEDIRLTQEEIWKALDETHKSDDIVDNFKFNCHAIANTATDKANRWWVKWIMQGEAFENEDGKLMIFHRDFSQEDLQALKELVEGEK